MIELAHGGKKFSMSQKGRGLKWRRWKKNSKWKRKRKKKEKEKENEENGK